MYIVQSTYMKIKLKSQRRILKSDNENKYIDVKGTVI